jgi:hypothetical protein
LPQVAGANFHADQARRQIGNKFIQLGAWHLGAPPHGLGKFIDAADGNDVFGEVNSNGYDSHDFPS